MTNSKTHLSSLLDGLLAKAAEYSAKGRSVAEQKLNIPDAGPERDSMIDGMKKGALASALLVGLLGTKTGRNLTGATVKLGGLAALGTLAYKGYQHWASDDESTQVAADEASTNFLASDFSADRSLIILKALVAASYADGHFDEDEIKMVRRELIEMHLPDSAAKEIELILESPLTAKQLANLASSEQQASEIYLATRLIVSKSASGQEQGYLSDLTRELEMNQGLLDSLESQLV